MADDHLQLSTPPPADEQDRRRLDGIRSLWEDGDYAAVGARFEPVSQQLVSMVDVTGRRVVDAATGTGNTALAAAAAGAEVVAFDLVPQLLEVARRRAAAAGLDIDWREGDLLAAPVASEAADVVVSTFGAFTADDPRRCAAELLRMCRPGGTVLVTAWHRDGAFGRLQTQLPARFPDALPAAEGIGPMDWADADGLASILDGHDVRVRTSVWPLPLAFGSVDAAITFFDEASGPFRRMRDALRSAGVDDREALDAITDAWFPATDRRSSGEVTLDATWTLATIDVPG